MEIYIIIILIIFIIFLNYIDELKIIYKLEHFKHNKINNIKIFDRYFLLYNNPILLYCICSYGLYLLSTNICHLSLYFLFFLLCIFYYIKTLELYNNNE